MAVAVRNMPDSPTQIPRPTSSLASASMMGAVYVIASLVILTVGVPMVWANGASEWLRSSLGSFVDVAGLIVVEIFAIGLLTMFGISLAGSNARLGLRAGVFSIVAWLVVTLIVVSMFSTGSPIGNAFGLALAGVSAFFGWRFMSGPKFAPTMQQFEHQGWFSAATYKPSQGKLVRRCTMIGFLALAGCGVWTLLQHGTLDSMGKDWIIRLPFMEKGITLLADVKFTLPIIIAALSFWLAYRVVHMPTFAEFLIATEGELNKIAWPTRKSLIQDTIVVLTTVVLMTVFLFVVDIAWGKILSNPYVGILKLAPEKQQVAEEDYKKLDW